jgi:thiamine-phosphate pyrophosphorylase
LPPAFLVGATANRSETARAAVAAGADYIGCGPAFASGVKALKPPVGPDGVRAVADAVPEVPVFAIGGIDESNAGQLAAAGVRRAAVITGLFETPDPSQSARALTRMLR